MTNNERSGVDRQVDASKPIIRVAVKRCAENELLIVRLLADTYGGLLTHYVRGRSQYCRGDDCPPIVHKCEVTWKGYCPALWYMPEERLWRPICLEITEHAELDMRGLVRRGQIWQLSRPLEPGKKNPPTYAAQLEDRGDQGLGPAFDVKPILQTLYHVVHLDLSVKNPLPPRVFAFDSDDAPPEVMRDQAEHQAKAAKQREDEARKRQERLKEQAEHFRARNGKPVS